MKPLNEPLVVIVGQTASGKSALAMDLARQFNGEIICADARTVYQGMDIGTAKPSQEEQAEVKHHLLDVVTPDQRFTAVDFQKLANEAIEDIQSRGKLPILVGGTGLYVDAVLFDYDFVASEGRDETNPRHAKQPGSRKDMRANTLVIGLDPGMYWIEQRIADRVEQMIKAGFVGEVRSQVEQYGTERPAFNAPGYKPFIEHINGSLGLEEAKAQFIKNDRQLAKRQKTWFKRNKSIHWIDSPLKAVDLVATFLSRD